MFTSEDHNNYFEQLARVERKMVYCTFELARSMEGSPLGGILKKMGENEVRHYGYILKMIEVATDPRQPEHEKRREPRKRCLGTIRLWRVQDQETEEVSARCVNLSTHGICLECSERLLPGTAWELEIQLFDTEELLGRRGRIVWCKEVEAGLYMSGMEFGP